MSSQSSSPSQFWLLNYLSQAEVAANELGTHQLCYVDGSNIKFDKDAILKMIQILKEECAELTNAAQGVAMINGYKEVTSNSVTYGKIYKNDERFGGKHYEDNL